VAAADEERRRLGRDLHDGAQQRLVRVLLALRLAERGADADTRALLDAAAEEADAAIAELRELGAGIHPQILTNRGLAAAVESLTGPLPLLVEATIPEARHPAGVEAAAYFVIAEALTNVLKHARATAASVTVREDGARLVVEVADDGRGGVDLDAGSGLRGLADRVAALDGTFSVLDGEGTTVRATLPL
jgi:signal transduction histidine kinase